MRQPNASKPSMTDVSAAHRTSRRARGFSLRPSPLVCLAAGALVLSGCDRAAPEPPATPEAVTPTIIVTTPLLDRAALLVEIDQAASNFASGKGQANTSLAGRRFKVRQPMGCGEPIAQGAAVPPSVASLTTIDRSGDLRLSLGAVDWTDDMIGGSGSGSWEAAEGFWLVWPWMRGETCPRHPIMPTKQEVSVDVTGSTNTDPESPMVESVPVVTLSPQTAALMSVFEEGSSRLSRRMGRAYEFVLRGQSGAPAVADPDGYRVVFEGRMAAFDDGQSIRCQAADIDQRPICAAAVHLERVAFETSKGQLLAEWR